MLDFWDLFDLRNSPNSSSSFGAPLAAAAAAVPLDVPSPPIAMPTRRSSGNMVPLRADLMWQRGALLWRRGSLDEK